jgi:hypothetical protein
MKVDMIERHKLDSGFSAAVALTLNRLREALVRFPREEIILPWIYKRMKPW